MPDTIKICLNNLRFRAFHGMHPDEREKGNDFVVNLEVSHTPGTATIVSLKDTIDYAELFDIINSAMQKPVELLETLVQTIAHNIYKHFPRVKEVNVSVEKLNPPIDHFSGSAAVKYSKNF